MSARIHANADRLYANRCGRQGLTHRCEHPIGMVDGVTRDSIGGEVCDVEEIFVGSKSQ